jgi:hypothetical protein
VANDGQTKTEKHQWTHLCTSIEKQHVHWCHKCGAIRVKSLRVNFDKATSYFLTQYLAMGSKNILKHAPPCYPVKLLDECEGLAMTLKVALARIEKAESDNAFLRNELKDLMPTF